MSLTLIITRGLCSLEQLTGELGFVSSRALISGAPLQERIAELGGQLAAQQAATEVLQRRVDAFDGQASNVRNEAAAAQQQASEAEKEAADVKLQLDLARAQADAARSAAVAMRGGLALKSPNPAELLEKLDVAADSIARLSAEVRPQLKGFRGGGAGSGQTSRQERRLTAFSRFK